MMKVIGTIVAVIVVVALVGLLVIYSGWYNVAATAKHGSLTLWVLDTTLDNSVEHHAKGIDAPDLTDSTMIAEGFEHFNEMCVDCHGAPGVKPEEFAEGLYPHAPDLVKHVDDWTPSELFWITKHGFESTGMPSFGVSHSDEQIWNIVAFLEKLPELDPNAYLQMRNATAGEDEEGEMHEHEEDEH